MNQPKSNNNSKHVDWNDLHDISIRSAVQMGAKLLKDHNIDNADYDSFALLSEINGMNRTYYLCHGDEMVPEQQLELFYEQLKKRSLHVPLQHIIGKAYFYGYEFIVNSDVLVPRPDTEVLVEEVKKVTNQNSVVLDMCTGSGCIILTLACEKHLHHGYGVDLSDRALLIAEQNRKKLSVDCVDFLQSDLYTKLGECTDQEFDVIVSNPPYIRSDVIPTLSEEVKKYDPMMALDGFEDGLFFYREITNGAKGHLKKDGWLCYEIGYDQADDVSQIMRTNGYTDITIVKDLNGLDRVVKGRFI